MALVPLPKLRAEAVQTSRRLLTCPALSKRDGGGASLLVVDMKGNVLEGRKRPFSELELHLACYAARPEVNVVLHAHPPYATAFGLAGREIGPVAMPEIVVSLGDRIPTLLQAFPKDPAALKALSEAAARYDAVVLAGNGVLTLGEDLTQAPLRMELVEHYAKILYLAQGRGTVCPLEPEKVQKLLEARKKAGLGPRSG